MLEDSPSRRRRRDQRRANGARSGCSMDELLEKRRSSQLRESSTELGSRGTEDSRKEMTAIRDQRESTLHILKRDS